MNYYLVTPLAYTGASASFTYESRQQLPVGSVVHISIGRRTSLGVITAIVTKPSFKTKPLGELALENPISAELLELAAWMSGYYATSPSSVFSTLLPSGLGKHRRELKSTKPFIAQGLPSTPLTADQTMAISQITAASATTLIQGVTGSGKTRVYQELTAQQLAAGRSVILLVPEIMLTPQTVQGFEHIFGSKVIASHSKLTEAQRQKIWEQAVASEQASEPVIIIGPRSCLFMPTHSLGLIMIDECHEPSYKQDQHPRYHAITVAAKRAQINRAKLVLGSATPGLTERNLANEGRIKLVKMDNTVNNFSLSKANIIDLRNKDLFKKSKYISEPLITAITAAIDEGRQSLLYLNRRGSASSQVCGDCGHVTICPHCLLPLTFHADLMKLICHHCNFRATSGAVCPQCRGANLKLLGGGTKRIEAEAEQLFPQARIARLDKDSATLSHIKTVDKALRRGEIDLLIGTQMIAKGLDLPTMDVVGVVSADTMLHLPDYTAGERTFQLLRQVAGRAGRGDRPGQVFVQTYTPDHPAITAAATGDYDAFAKAELAERRALGYPPFSFLLQLSVAAKTPQAAAQEAKQFHGVLAKHSSIKVTGPAPKFIEFQAGHYHWVLTVRALDRRQLVQIATQLPSTHWTADLDPGNLL